MSYTPTPHPPLESTGEFRVPKDGEWFRCSHPECLDPDCVHRMEGNPGPFMPECEILREKKK